MERKVRRKRLIVSFLTWFAWCFYGRSAKSSWKKVSLKGFSFFCQVEEILEGEDFVAFIAWR